MDALQTRETSHVNSLSLEQWAGFGPVCVGKYFTGNFASLGWLGPLFSAACLAEKKD